jgi:hypothetical protein
MVPSLEKIAQQPVDGRSSENHMHKQVDVNAANKNVVAKHVRAREEEVGGGSRQKRYADSEIQDEEKNTEEQEKKAAFKNVDTTSVQRPYAVFIAEFFAHPMSLASKINAGHFQAVARRHFSPAAACAEAVLFPR